MKLKSFPLSLLLLPLLAISPGCNGTDGPNKGKSSDSGKLQARVAMPECEGRIDACSTADDACKGDDEACAQALFKCFDEIPEACFPPLPEGEPEDIPEDWVDIFEVCFENPKLDECFNTYDSCVSGGTDENTCYEALSSCVDPLLSDECKAIEDAGASEDGFEDETELPKEEIPEDIGELDELPEDNGGLEDEDEEEEELTDASNEKDELDEAK